ncbi:ABC transporter substrate-binding protein [Amycolatopsis ultiminotia]|uniref:ABC transporter substrate-binding protein n=1 Tax=Amycolatopsis ultiminotia TaxID=543629 RepID=A0ABP6WXR4_9PSEU
MRRILSTVIGTAIVAITAAGLTACGSSDTSGQTLRVGTLTDAPPSIYLDNGRFTGYDNELLRDIAQREGFQVDFVSTEFSTLLGKVAGGQLDIGSSTISATSARKKTVNFSNGYDTSYTTVVSKKGAALPGANSFGGKRLGVVQGSVQDEFAGKLAGAEVVRFPDYNAGFAQLRSGGLDGWVVPKDIGQKYFDQNPSVPLEFGYTVLDKDTPSAFAVAKSNTDLLNKINDGLAKAIADGTAAKLHAQFYRAAPIAKELDKGGAGLPVKNS